MHYSNPTIPAERSNIRKLEKPREVVRYELDRIFSVSPQFPVCLERRAISPSEPVGALLDPWFLCMWLPALRKSQTMSARELASARSFWKRKNLRDGRRSRMSKWRRSPLTVTSGRCRKRIVDQVMSVLPQAKKQTSTSAYGRTFHWALKVYRLHKNSAQEEARDWLW